MCGIAGIIDNTAVAPPLIRGMVEVLHHRGPDQRGYYLNHNVALGSARLSIVDLRGGVQPIQNERRDLVMVMNGEIYNYPELTQELLGKGYKFRTRCDTEVALHLFEEYGPAFVERLNGQFAIAIWDKTARKLTLARDRPGIRPLFYYDDGKRLLFASEIKAIFADKRVQRELDPVGIDQIFTFWTMIADATCFAGVKQLPSGSYLEYGNGRLRVKKYWDYPLACEDGAESVNGKSEQHLLEALQEKLAAAVRLRLRADVPVGSYLSGGIDSSAIALLAQRKLNGSLKTYSVAFTDPALDESAFQEVVARRLDTDHKSVRCDYLDIGVAFPGVVWHTEQPVFRTAPAPLYLLSKLVRSHAAKVVLTGEGADEVLWGYDLYKEAKIRRFWSRHPSSRMRPQLLQRLYSHLPQFQSPRYFSLLVDFYRGGLTDTDDPYYSHQERWKNSISQKIYYSSNFKSRLVDYDSLEHLASSLPEGFARLGKNEKAQYLECHTLLSGYLLSSQGDRMSMAHSVEARYPFLDHEFIEFSAKLPAKYKLRGLKDKYLLRKAFEKELPREIAHRPKHAYQAPEIRSFINKGKTLDYASALTNKQAIEEVGVFDHKKVSQLIAKATGSKLDRTGTRNNLAFVQILSTQLLHELFVKKTAAGDPSEVEYHVIT